MEKKPSNTREQGNFDSGGFAARRELRIDPSKSAAGWFDICKKLNPHKHGTNGHYFWSEGFNWQIANPTINAGVNNERV